MRNRKGPKTISATYPELDPSTHALVERLGALRRPSGSSGSRAAAELVGAALARAGARVELEDESVHGTYWLPLGLLQLVALLPRRASALVACVGVVNELWIARRRPLRRLLGRRRAVNVVAELGPRDAARTVVVHAHHDAAHTGRAFDPRPLRALARVFPGLRTTPPLLWAALAGPALRGAGARRAGTLASLGMLAALIDIARAPVVPGACDNLSGVAALVQVAQRLRGAELDVRMLLVSTDAEESFLEGMAAFLARHEHELPRERTTFVCLESVGSEQLVLLDGEGMLKLHRYPAAPADALAAAAERLGIEIERGMRFRFATDGQLALLAGYPAAVLSSVDWYRAPRNYHLPSDDPEHVNLRSAAGAAAVVAAYSGGP
jgi:Peptidase family M28